MALTDRQRRFVDEYLVDLNGTQAAIPAGYAKSGAHTEAFRQLATPEVVDAIAETQAAPKKRTNVTAEFVVRELLKHATASLLDYTRVTDDGLLEVDMSVLNRANAAALAEVTIDEVKGGEIDGKKTSRVKIKTTDKLRAL